MLIEGADVAAGESLPPVEGFVSNYPLSMPAAEVVARVQRHIEAKRQALGLPAREVV